MENQGRLASTDGWVVVSAGINKATVQDVVPME
jgi:hypothetical protein